MSRVLQPHPEGGRNWALAFTISAAFHAAAAVYFLGIIPFDTPDEAPPVSFLDIAISNTVLEQQQLAALEPEEAAQISASDADDVPTEEAVQPDTDELAPVEAEDLSQAEAEELAPVEAEDLSQAETEELAPVEAEDLAQAETEELAPVDGEDLAPAEVEELAPVEVEDLSQAEAEQVAALEPDTLETLAPVLPDAPAVTEQASPILPETPEAEVVAPTPSSPALAPITPLAPSDNTTIQGATVEAVRPATVAAAPVVSSVQTIARVAPVVAAPPPPRVPAPTPRPTPTAAPPPPAASAEDLAVLELIKRIRGRFGDPCLIALPQNQGPGRNPLVTLISDQERSMSAFVTEVLNDPDLPVDDRRVVVDSRQCAALDYARAHRNYPAFRIDLTLQGRTIASGNNLVGRLAGLGGRYTSLLAVDSNGVVTDLRRFTQFRQGTAVLDAPVNINGSPRDTSHLLIAIATPGLPSTVAQRSGWLAQDFFPPLKDETDGQAVIAILPFDVR